MFTLFSILTAVVFILMLLVAAVQPAHSKLNLFELERRSKIGDKQAKKDLARERLLRNIVSMQKILLALLQVAAFTFAELAFGMWFGIFVALLIAFGCESIAHLSLIRHTSQKIYNRIEPSILVFIKKNPFLFRVISGRYRVGDYYNLRIDSREELQHLISESDSVLTSDEKKLVVHSLTFNDRLVKTIMTPRSKIVSIDKAEFLGPLMLDDLHKVGHSRLPVVNGDINCIVGILNLKSLLSLDSKKSLTAEKAMESRVYYINEEQTLHHALVALLHTHHHLLVVVDESKETVGILTLEDIIEALIGRQVVDCFNDHSDLHAVASRKKA